MLSLVSGDIQLFQHLFVALKDLDRIPALLLLRHIVDDCLLDMRDRVLDGAGEIVLRNGLSALCRCDRGLGRLVNAGALQCGDLNDLAAELTGQLLHIDLVAVLLNDIHHVDCNDDRNAQLNELCGQVEVALQIRAVDDIEDRVRALADQIVTRNDLLQRIRRERVDAGQVGDDDIIMLFQLALFLFDGNTRPVSDELI